MSEKKVSLLKLKSFENMNCSLAQALTVVGERWSLLIIRDVSSGVTRFDDIQKSLGVARNMLSTRLKQLIEAAVLVREADTTGAVHYRLTDKGWDLMPVLLALTHWGDKHLPDDRGERLIFVDKEGGRPIQSMEARNADGRPLKYFEYRAVKGPALR